MGGPRQDVEGKLGEAFPMQHGPIARPPLPVQQPPMQGPPPRPTDVLGGKDSLA